MTFDESDYWQSIGDPHPRQLELLELTRTNRRVAATAGRRFGKSWLLSAWVLWRTLKGEQVWWVAPSHQLARVGFEYALSLARRLPTPIRERLIIKRSSPYEIGFRSGLCQFLSSDNEWQLQGRGLDLIVVDEAGEIDNLIYLHDQYLSPCLLDRAGSLICIGTPRGRHTDYFQLCGRPEFVRFVGSSYDNPYINKDELERLSAELPEQLKLQELQGEFVDVTGRAFPDIAIDLLDVDNVERAAVGIDWGIWSPAAAVLVVRLHDGRYYAMDEIYVADSNAHQFADMVSELVRNNNVSRCDFIIDSSTFNRTDGLVTVAERFRERGVPVLPATRDRLGSLALLRQLMAERKLVISPACTSLLDELRSAELIDGKGDFAGSDHAIDALRYAIAHLHQYPLRKEPETTPEAIWQHSVRVARRQRAGAKYL
jgi:hypothetical protein